MSLRTPILLAKGTMGIWGRKVIMMPPLVVETVVMVDNVEHSLRVRQPFEEEVQMVMPLPLTYSPCGLGWAGAVTQVWEGRGDRRKSPVPNGSNRCTG